MIQPILPNVCRVDAMAHTIVKAFRAVEGPVA
jgi:hypothetical protein